MKEKVGSELTKKELTELLEHMIQSHTYIKKEKLAHIKACRYEHMLNRIVEYKKSPELLRSRFRSMEQGQKII
jgi:hypothetical protein